MSTLFDKPKIVPTPEVSAAASPAPTPIRRDVNVAVESDGSGGYWVTRVRGNAASAAVLYTRDELVELRARIAAALEIGK